MLTFCVCTGPLPGTLSELAHVLQMPAKMAEALISKNPTLKTITVQQVSAGMSGQLKPHGESCHVSHLEAFVVKASPYRSAGVNTKPVTYSDCPNLSA